MLPKMMRMVRFSSHRKITAAGRLLLPLVPRLHHRPVKKHRRNYMRVWALAARRPRVRSLNRLGRYLCLPGNLVGRLLAWMSWALGTLLLVSGARRSAVLGL